MTRNFFCLMPGDFNYNIWAWDIVDVGEVHSMPAGSRAEGATPFCSLSFSWLWRSRWKFLYEHYSLWWNLAVVLWPWNWTNRHKHLYHHDPRQFAKFDARQKWFLFLFHSRSCYSPWVCCTKPNCTPAILFQITRMALWFILP